MKMKTYVSEHGEIFEGTQAELMRAKGIKHKMGFQRPSGAVDAEGTRWAEEGKTITKPNLYLNGGFFDHLNFINKKGETIITQRYSSSDTSALMKFALQVLQDTERWLKEVVAECKLIVKETYARYNVIDNIEAIARRFMAGTKKTAAIQKHYADHYGEVPEEYQNADIKDLMTDNLNELYNYRKSFICPNESKFAWPHLTKEEKEMKYNFYTTKIEGLRNEIKALG